MNPKRSTRFAFVLLNVRALLGLLAQPRPAQTAAPQAPAGTQIYCSSPALSIPDDDPTGVSDGITVPDDGAIQDVNLVLNVSHTWVGDLIFTLNHNATDVTAFDQPGVPPGSLGCSGNDLSDIVLDDNPGGTPGTPVDTSCNDVSDQPAYETGGSYTPNNPLSAFDGDDINGDWTLTASDNAGGDTGTLNSWCVEVTWAVDTPPVAVDDSGPGFITDEATPITLGNVLANDWDPQGDPLSLESYDPSAALGLVGGDARRLVGQVVSGIDGLRLQADFLIDMLTILNL